MSEMVERVARAIESADRFDTRRNKSRAAQFEVYKVIPDDKPIPYEGARVIGAYASHEEATDAAVLLTRDATARAAIRAMRALTPAMFSAGLGLSLEKGWKAMIDEALK